MTRRRLLGLAGLLFALCAVLSVALLVSTGNWWNLAFAVVFGFGALQVFRRYNGMPETRSDRPRPT
jgi:hypothetical protein